MKRTIAAVAFILVFSVLAAMNGQEIIPLASGVYDAMDALFIMEGKAIPSTTRPWSVAETEKYLSMVSESTSPGLYAAVLKEIGRKATVSFDETVDIRLGLSSNLNVYYHTNTSFDFPFDETDNYFFRMFGDNDRSTLDFKAGIYGLDSIYLYFSFQMRTADCANEIPFHSYRFNFDLYYFTPDGLTYDVDLLLPDRAFLAAGGSFWNLQLGRDRFSIGTGETGSLIFSDSFLRNDLLRFNLFGTRFKFSYALISFWHPNLVIEGDEMTKGAYAYMTNRFEGHLFSDRLYLAFNNTTLFKNDNDDGINLRYLNPIDYYHNFFVRYRQNSSCSFEAVFAFAKGWNVYGQLLIDDISSPGEAKGGDSAPDELGFMLGIKHNSAHGNGILGVNLEAVYTLPFLYHRSTRAYSQPDDDTGLSYIGLIRFAGGGVKYKRYYIGYPYGGDAAVLDLRVSYAVPGNYSLKAEGFFMVHGEKNYDSKYVHGQRSWALSGERKTYGYFQLYGRKELNEHIGVFGQYNLGYAAGDIDNQFVLGAAIGY